VFLKGKEEKKLGGKVTHKLLKNPWRGKDIPG